MRVSDADSQGLEVKGFKGRCACARLRKVHSNPNSNNNCTDRLVLINTHPYPDIRPNSLAGYVLRPPIPYSVSPFPP